jgi:hypothetical protein
MLFVSFVMLIFDMHRQYHIHDKTSIATLKTLGQNKKNNNQIKGMVRYWLSMLMLLWLMVDHVQCFRMVAFVPRRQHLQRPTRSVLNRRDIGFFALPNEWIQLRSEYELKKDQRDTNASTMESCKDDSIDTVLDALEALEQIFNKSVYLEQLIENKDVIEKNKEKARRFLVELQQIRVGIESDLSALR